MNVQRLTSIIRVILMHHVQTLLVHLLVTATLALRVMVSPATTLMNVILEQVIVMQMVSAQIQLDHMNAIVMRVTMATVLAVEM